MRLLLVRKNTIFQTYLLPVKLAFCQIVGYNAAGYCGVSACMHYYFGEMNIMSVQFEAILHKIQKWYGRVVVGLLMMAVAFFGVWCAISGNPLMLFRVATATVSIIVAATFFMAVVLLGNKPRKFPSSKLSCMLINMCFVGSTCSALFFSMAGFFALFAYRPTEISHLSNTAFNIFVTDIPSSVTILGVVGVVIFMICIHTYVTGRMFKEETEYHSSVLQFNARCKWEKNNRGTQWKNKSKEQHRSNEKEAYNNLTEEHKKIKEDLRTLKENIECKIQKIEGYYVRIEDTAFCVLCFLLLGSKIILHFVSTASTEVVSPVLGAGVVLLLAVKWLSEWKFRVTFGKPHRLKRPSKCIMCILFIGGLAVGIVPSLVLGKTHAAMITFAVNSAFAILALSVGLMQSCLLRKSSAQAKDCNIKTQIQEPMMSALKTILQEKESSENRSLTIPTLKDPAPKASDVADVWGGLNLKCSPPKKYKKIYDYSQGEIINKKILKRGEPRAKMIDKVHNVLKPKCKITGNTSNLAKKISNVSIH